MSDNTEVPPEELNPSIVLDDKELQAAISFCREKSIDVVHAKKIFKCLEDMKVCTLGSLCSHHQTHDIYEYLQLYKAATNE